MIQPYNPFRPLFYPVVLILLFGTIYLIYQTNPALMDQLALVEKRSDVKQTEGYLATTGPLATDSVARFQPSGLGANTLNRSLAYPESYKIEFRFEKDETSLAEMSTTTSDWSADDNGFVLRGENGFDVYTSAGKKQWSFITKSQTLPNGPLAVTSELIYFTTTDGDVSCFYRNTGKVAWIRRFFAELMSQPVIVAGELVVFKATEDEKKWNVVRMSLSDGELKGVYENVNAPVAGMTFHESQSIMASASADGLVKVYDLIQGKALWSNTFPNTFVAPPTSIGDRLYLMSKEGQLFATDMTSGRLIWETDLKDQFNSNLTIIPKISIGVIADRENYVHVIDLKTGKRKWRYNLKADAKNHRIVALKMTPGAATRLNMTPESQGWSFWAACDEHSLCAFEPIKGFILKKLELPAQMQGWPRFIDNGMELVQTYVENKVLKFRKFIEKRKLDQISKTTPETPVDNAPGEI